MPHLRTVTRGAIILKVFDVMGTKARFDLAASFVDGPGLRCTVVGETQGLHIVTKSSLSPQLTWYRHRHACKISEDGWILMSGATSYG